MHPLPLPRWPGVALLVAVGGVALVVSALTVKAPLVAVVAVGLLLLLTIFGMEGLIAVSLLGACGLLPFLDPNALAAGEVKVYALLFLAGGGAMAGAYATRVAARRPRWPFPVNALSIGLVALLAYVSLVGLASDTREVPALAAPFFILPMAGLATILWLSHGEATAGLRRAMPLILAIIVAWALAYDAGAAGCAPCASWVGADQFNEGLLGPESRLYTAGQNSFLALFLIAFAYMLVRPNPLTISLVALGALTVALQTSRAQYLAVLVSLALLVAWKMGQLRFGGRVAVAAVCALALLAIASSPAGDRAATLYTEIQSGTGTGAYRLNLVENTSDAWTLLGQGFSTTTLELGFDIDLGIPNTLLVLGYVGAALQLLLLGLGAVRGFLASNLAGITVAAILVMVLAARPTLPLLEYGHSAVMYGAVLGFAAVLTTGGLARGGGRSAAR